MAAPAAELRGRSLLAIFAHPDDESLACGGLLAWCAHRGARVSLLCLTDGGHGPDARRAGGAKRTRHSSRHEGAPPRRSVGPRDGLGQLRAQELGAACRTLGVDDLVLLNYEDGMLPWVDGARLEADIQRAIHRVRPDVVITFDEDGLYWHPDHIAVHERTTAAVAAAGAEGPALYYVTIPPGGMRAVVQYAEGALASRGLDGPSPLRILGIADPDAFGAVAPAPTLIVDAAEFASRKLAAIRCHRSQLTDDALDLVDAGDAARLLGVEHYRRAAVGFPGDTFVDRLSSPLTT
jgi:N-acetyl-1-D-myo-inositol-2-amino-2-deoxy-alpha-D-glucopyranoside deacetylase